MKFALMGKVLCASCKIERRSNVIQRLFKRSCIIAKAFLSPQEKRNARVSGGIFVSTSRKSSTISFVVGMSANFSIKHLRVVFTNSITSWLQAVKFIRWSATKRVDSLSKKEKKKNEWWTRPSSDFLLSNFLCHPSKASIFFRVTRVLSNRLCTPRSWTTVSIHRCTSLLHFLFTLYQPYHFYIMYLLIIILICLVNVGKDLIRLGAYLIFGASGHRGSFEGWASRWM